MNRILADYLTDLRRQLKALPVRERDAVLHETRLHLEESMRRLRKEDKKLSADEAALKATHDFGDPKEIAVAHSGQGVVLKRSTGEILLDVAVLTARGTGRTIKTTVKYTGIALGVLLIVALVLAVVAAFIVTDLAKTYKDEITEAIPHPIYEYSHTWGLTEPQTTVVTGDFDVAADAKEVRITVSTSPQTGCAAIQIFGPDNAVRYENGGGCSSTSQELRFTTPGHWRIQYTFIAFTGTIGVNAVEYQDADG